VNIHLLGNQVNQVTVVGLTNSIDSLLSTKPKIPKFKN